MSRSSFARMVARLGLVAAFGMFASGPAAAQSTSARVEGVVADSSGAVVPGATVTATNEGTNVSRSAVSDAQGNYVLTPLPIGRYKVKAELSGFKTQVASATLSVNEVSRIDFKLDLGSVTEDEITVTATAPIIEKSTSFMGTVIDNKQVENLPLNGRNFTQLATLTPGVTRGVPGSVASGESGNTETFRYGEVGGGAISVNGLREQFNNFQLDGVDNNEVLTNSVVFFPSVEALQEFRVITTNAPAEFGRAGGAVTNLVTKSGTNEFHGSAFDFYRAKGLAATPTFSTEKPEFKRNEFGATFGGPLVKDKTFFFVNFKGVRDSIPVEAGGRVTVPTARMRNGDFSELLNPSFTGVGQPITIYDPLTGQPFPGNVIPGNRLNPVAVRYLNLFPLPDVTSQYQQNLFTHRQRDSDFNDFDVRLDHNFSQKDTAFLRFSLADDSRFDPGRISCCQAGFGSGGAEAKAVGGVLGQTHVFSPSVVNELRVGYNYYRYAFLPVGFGTDQNALAGIPGPGGIHLANGISLIGGGNGSWIEYLGDFGEYVVKQRSFQISDSVTYIRGAHNFKAGISVIRRNMQTTQADFGKGFYFFSDFTATPGNVPPLGQTGFEVSDMLIGTTQFTATGVPGYEPFTTISWENAAFIQDDWRVNRKLTLNLGLRYDIFTPYYEQDDRLSNFDPTTQRLVLPGQNGVPRSTVDTDYNNLGPRAGFAYQVNDKTVVRGAYGIFYSLDRGGIGNQLTQNPPFTVTEFRFDGPLAHVRLSDPIALPTRVDPNNPGDLPQGSGVKYLPRDTQNTRVQQYNLGFQREITSNTALMMSYVGTHGDHLTAITSQAGFGGAILGRITSVQNIATSSYNSLQATLRRTAANFSYLASYTLGHARNDSPGPFPGQSSAFRNTPTDPRNLSLDEGDADYDVRHRFTLASTWALPFLKDNKVLGGWSMNGIVTLSTGTPYTVFDGNGRASLVAGQDPNDGPKTSDQWFNTAAFGPSSAGAAERNIVRGPGIKTLDLSLFKTFGLGDRAKLELRFEGFNVTNTPQYELIQDNLFLGSGAFGKIQRTRLNSERQVQLAARVLF